MQQDPLQQLRDVHTPAEPGWWPPAPGWWILFALVLGLLGWLGWQLWQRHQRLRPFRAAQALHRQLCADLAASRISQETYLHEANALLKRTFIHGRHDPTSAALAGTQWIAYLNQYLPDRPFSKTSERLLSQARFAATAPQPAAHISELQQQITAALQQAASA